MSTAERAVVSEKASTEDPSKLSSPPSGPDYAFEPERTRVEQAVFTMPRRIVALKLDHVGDFLLGVPSYRALRAAFPVAELTIVVGSWNEEGARELGMFEQVLVCDIYPRDGSATSAQLAERAWLLAHALDGRYDLAIDLRTDSDSRFLLQTVPADIRAGLGSRQIFPFLDIFLPIDFTRGVMESAWDEHLSVRTFQARSSFERADYVIRCAGTTLPAGGGLLVWGPSRPLPIGEYRFQPFVEVKRVALSALRFDIALNGSAVTRGSLLDASPQATAFNNHVDRAPFEFRIWASKRKRLPPFRFYGGRLVKKGSAGVLPQPEYMYLLVQLIAFRFGVSGSLVERGQDHGK